MTAVVIVGGGLAGLACGVALADRGIALTLLEAQQYLGGRAASWRDEATRDMVDIGPHIFHSEYRNMLGFLERLGTGKLITWQTDEILTLATKPAPLQLRHAPLPAPLTLIPSILRAPGLSMPDYLSMARTGWRGMRFGEEQVGELDQVSALDFLRAQGVTENMIDWWWRFASMVVTNVPLERCSMASLLRIHAQLSGYRGLQFGFAAVGLGELFTGQARHLIEKSGGRVLTGSAVQALAGDDRIDQVICSDGTRLDADVVVSAVPPAALAAMLNDAQTQRAALDDLGWFEPSPYICCYLWFDRPLRTDRFTSHLWSPTRLNYDFYDLRQIREGWQRRPSVIASNIIYSHRAAHLDDEALVRATRAELAEFAPDAAQASLLHARVHRVPMAIPCPLVGFEQRRPPQRSALPGLVLAGDWTSTGMPCTMEGAVKSGLLAAQVVLEQLGRPEQLASDARMYDGLAGLARRATAPRPRGVPGASS